MIIDGIEYIRADSAAGKRAVIVCDRGWIFAGDVTEENGRIRLARAIHVCSWSDIGFDGLITAGKSTKVVLKPISDVDIPADSELFRVAVSDNWGL